VSQDNRNNIIIVTAVAAFVIGVILGANAFLMSMFFLFLGLLAAVMIVVGVISYLSDSLYNYRVRKAYKNSNQ
jgi:predicted phage tail protein